MLKQVASNIVASPSTVIKGEIDSCQLPPQTTLPWQLLVSVIKNVYSPEQRLGIIESLMTEEPGSVNNVESPKEFFQ